MFRSITGTIVLSLLCATAIGAARESNEWRSAGPSPPAVEAATGTDLASCTIYIGSPGGGESCVAVNNGLDSLTISALAIDSSSPDRPYASTSFSVCKSVKARRQ
jgi:hypothetical protein